MYNAAQQTANQAHGLLQVVIRRADALAAGGRSRIDELEQLAALRDRGALSEDEFSAMKVRLLKSSGGEV